jgi:hypothetical protein
MHIAFQPLFINAFAMAIARQRFPPERRVYGLAAATGFYAAQTGLMQTFEPYADHNGANMHLISSEAGMVAGSCR